MDDSADIPGFFSIFPLLQSILCNVHASSLWILWPNICGIPVFASAPQIQMPAGVRQVKPKWVKREPPKRDRNHSFLAQHRECRLNTADLIFQEKQEIYFINIKSPSLKSLATLGEPKKTFPCTLFGPYASSLQFFFFRVLFIKVISTPNMWLKLTTRDQELHAPPTEPARHPHFAISWWTKICNPSLGHNASRENFPDGCNLIMQPE